VLGFAPPFRIPEALQNGNVTMLRQFNRRGALTIALALVMSCGVAACGIKGPLRPAPKTDAKAPAAPIDNPATPPATTSPALPPPSSSSERTPAAPKP
jgi:predicted small lipoprotein YifL